MDFPLIVLAGGFGTRLKPVVQNQPKPLAQVCGKPFLEYLINSWVCEGQKNFIFLLHYEADKIIDYLKSLESHLLDGCKYLTIVEEIPLGTGGAVANAVQNYGISKNFLVTNADTWIGGSVKAMRGAALPSIAVTEVSDVSRYGAILFDRNAMVTDFVEKGERTGEGWINAGMYHLSADMFANWDGKGFSLERELLPRLVAKRQLHAIFLQAEFIDIGIPLDYQRFDSWIKSGRTLPL